MPTKMSFKRTISPKDKSKIKNHVSIITSYHISENPDGSVKMTKKRTKKVVIGG